MFIEQLLYSGRLWQALHSVSVHCNPQCSSMEFVWPLSLHRSANRNVERTGKPAQSRQPGYKQGTHTHSTLQAMSCAAAQCKPSFHSFVQWEAVAFPLPALQTLLIQLADAEGNKAKADDHASDSTLKQVMCGLQGSSQLLPQIGVNVSKFHPKVRFPWQQSAVPSSLLLVRLAIRSAGVHCFLQALRPESQESFSLSCSTNMQSLWLSFLFLFFFIPSPLFPLTSWYLKITYAMVIDVQGYFLYVGRGTCTLDTA